MIGLKIADEGSCVIPFWRHRNNQDVSNSENILPKLSEVSNEMFSSLRREGFITEKQLKCFTYKYKKATILVNYTSQNP